LEAWWCNVSNILVIRNWREKGHGNSTCSKQRYSITANTQRFAISVVLIGNAGSKLFSRWGLQTTLAPERQWMNWIDWFGLLENQILKWDTMQDCVFLRILSVSTTRLGISTFRRTRFWSSPFPNSTDTSLRALVMSLNTILLKTMKFPVIFSPNSKITS